MNSPHLLAEAAVFLIQDTIKANIEGALATVRAYYDDGKVTTEPPPTTSYFIYPKAHGYRCPAIFIIDDTTDFRLSQKQANYINAAITINVSLKVEDKDQYKLAVKAWRYVAALHSILDQATLVSADETIKLVVKVERAKPGPMYTLEDSDAETAQFFKEYVLQCQVEFYEKS